VRMVGFVAQGLGERVGRGELGGFGALDLHARALARDTEGGDERDEERGSPPRGPDPPWGPACGPRAILGADAEEAGALVTPARDDLALLLAHGGGARPGGHGAGGARAGPRPRRRPPA